jgi:MoaA/NifB/PqqE/SkfB family radical SAM enzyme
MPEVLVIVPLRRREHDPEKVEEESFMMRPEAKPHWINFYRSLFDKNKRGSLPMRIRRHAHLKLSQFISQYFSGYALRPVELNVEISSQCNLRCRMCPSKVIGQKLLLQPDIDAISNAIARLGVKVVRFSGLGEPMMAPAFWDVAKVANQNDCRVAMVTNGTLLDEGAIDRLCAISHMITISLDSATPETYRYIRGADAFDNIYGAIRNLYRQKSIIGRSLPIIAINWVLMKSNYRELPLLIRRLLADGIKIDLIHCDPLISYTQAMEEEVLLINKRLTEYLNGVRDEGLAAGILLEYPYYARASHAEGDGPPLPGKVSPSCTVIWESLFVSLECKLLPCCEYYLNQIGNIASTDPRNAWNSRIMREARIRSVQGLPPFQYCSNCHKYLGDGNPYKMLKRASNSQ